jgi:hypothetical protein
VWHVKDANKIGVERKTLGVADMRTMGMPWCAVREECVLTPDAKQQKMIREMSSEDKVLFDLEPFRIL